MIYAKAILVDQFLANVNDRSWYASFQESVEGLSNEEAFWKPYEESHSIAEITQHLIYWNEVWQMRFETSNFHAIETLNDNASSFHIHDNESFTELKEKLFNVLLRWEEFITVEKLESNVNGFPVKAEW
ncbi:DinB superfamily protein [Piscibacillus halophilus]|uniref:DinB superfamily protein n=1 Tax=Piscibacillus halophilus TaxID=571933 RepID=A0A1H9M3M0_9BACI|nr:DinB superfamily protein [Piscibacillus halophilus]